MPAITVEIATLNDLPALCRLRAEQSGFPLEWEPRITAYMIGQQSPPFALDPREVFVAVEDNEVVGMTAGHLTRRFGCEGEIHWLNVQSDQRGRRIADHLLRALAGWFVAHKARKVCVNVNPTNDAARRVFTRHGAQEMGPLWMVFEDIGSLAAPSETPAS